MKVNYWTDELWPVHDLFLNDDDHDYESEGQVEIDKDLYFEYTEAQKKFLSLRLKVNDSIRKQSKKTW